MTRETVLEIDLKALEHNFNYLKSKLHPQVKFMPVVKAFAYGSDSVAVSKKLEELGADYLAVAYTKEGIRLRENGITKPILVLHPQSTNFEEIAKYNLTPSLYSEFVIRAFLEDAQRLNLKNYPIHLKFNTGLNRLGLTLTEIDLVADLLQNQTYLKIEGAFSHLAASEDVEEKPFTQHQIEHFQKVKKSLEAKFQNHKILFHLCNTSGILNYPEAHFDLVRSGIGLYGFGNSVKEDQNLIPISTLKTIISQIHHLKKGESLGYNRQFTAQKDTKTATLPIGHADGINRIYGKGKCSVLINGKEALIVGNVCMDMIMVDITGIDCQEGDEVILFGKNRSAENFAKSAGTISYELVTSVSQRVNRKIINS
ncbi:alanine racemase [Mesonia sp. K7]|uniref:alanine racemase n=1 Tax=Mesonia sp. K7 TaxID=2218606 RepID=UPI000DA8362D|nr:alanine racemase [Mesonia sp. K7]PZD77399.1 alanine racemase [Mesonia sp. K7]